MATDDGVDSQGTFADYVDALARRLTPLASLSYYQAVRDLVRTMDTDSLTRVIETGGASAVVAAFLGDDVLTAALAPIQDAIRSIIARAGARFYKDTPPGPPDATPIVKVRFNALAPEVQQVITKYERTVIVSTAQTLRETVQQAVAEGLREGVNPRAIAVRLKGVLGLAPNQEAYLRNYESELRALANADTRAILRGVLNGGKVPGVLSRELSDGTFDRTVKSAILNDRALTNSEINRGLARYTANLEMQQRTTVARTVTLNAMREAQRASWAQAVKAGKVEESELIDTWITTLDGRERPKHHAMHGTQKRHSDDWIVPGVGRQKYPGETEFNCRCRVWTSVRIRRASGG